MPSVRAGRVAILAAALVGLAAGEGRAQTSPPPVDVIVTLDPSLAAGGHAARQGQAAQVARGLGLQPRRAYGTALFGFAATVP